MILGIPALFAVLAASSPSGADPAPGAEAPAATPCPASPPEGMSCIPGGEFIRGSDNGPANERPASRVWVQTFLMDRYEVTTEQYKACMKAGKCPKAGPRYNDFSRPRQPVTGVSWYDAVAYCRAQGKRLPTEAEWEKAARGPDGNLYPWGNEKVTCKQAVIEDSRGRSCGIRKAGPAPEKGRTLEVGTRPAGIYDLYDMIGNSWEWVADWYSPSWAKCGTDCAGPDPKGPCGGADKCPGHRVKVVRGGSWYWPASYATGTYRRTHVPSNDPYHHFGFRCAVSIP